MNDVTKLGVANSHFALYQIPVGNPFVFLLVSLGNYQLENTYYSFM